MLGDLCRWQLRCARHAALKPLDLQLHAGQRRTQLLCRAADERRLLRGCSGPGYGCYMNAVR